MEGDNRFKEVGIINYAMEIINEENGNEILKLNERLKININHHPGTSDIPVMCELFYSTGLKRFLISNTRKDGYDPKNPDFCFSIVPSEARKLMDALEMFFEKYEWSDNDNDGIETQ